MATSLTYTRKDYDARDAQTRRAAVEILAILFEYIQPDSVVDFGCGVGTWLSVCQEHGVREIRGLDGPWVPADRLTIPPAAFQPADLANPIELDRTFDLAISLEVAEHLPEQSAESFVRSLTIAAPHVLFSAAIPLQTGNGHINEQWQDYWAELFLQQDYVAIDLIRPRIWNRQLPVHYRQNILFYAKRSHISPGTLLFHAWKNTNEGQLRVVHPEVYMFKHQLLAAKADGRMPVSGREAAAALCRSLKRRLARVIGLSKL